MIKFRYLLFIYWQIAKETLRFLYKQMKRKGQTMVIIDAPLLFETFFLKYICYPICVVVVEDQEKQIQNILKRNAKWTREEIVSRLGH